MLVKKFVLNIMQNDYNEIAEVYKKTDNKPDKRYSILPTVLLLAGDLSGKTVLDIGCGSGFFSRVLAETALIVIGIDNSEQQLKIAKQDKKENPKYLILDFKKDELPQSDVVVAPFVLGYCKNVDQLKIVIEQIYNSLSSGGKFIGVIDLPTGRDLKRYGAVKILSKKEDGQEMQIQLTDGENVICALSAAYYSVETMERILKKVGFTNIVWQKPIVSQEGIETMSDGFWDGYVDNCELGYFTAVK